MALHKNILSVVGNTPMVQLQNVSQEEGGIVCAKLECLNPMGSVKDRPALAMIEAAERSGDLRRGDIIAEATSGNTGLGLAMVGAVKGYQVVLFVELIDMLPSVEATAKALGANIINTDDFESAVRAAEEYGKNNANVFVPHQFRNLENPSIHERTTAIEIIEDVGPKIKAFVGSFGSGGTITGVGRALKRYNPDIEIVLVEPETVQLFSGGKVTCSEIHGVGPTFRPDIMQHSVHDRIIQVGKTDAWKMACRLASEEGMICGPSSGALAYAATEIAREFDPGDVVVTIFPDTGNRYLDTGLFESFNNIKQKIMVEELVA